MIPGGLRPELVPRRSYEDRREHELRLRAETKERNEELRGLTRHGWISVLAPAQPGELTCVLRHLRLKYRIETQRFSRLLLVGGYEPRAPYFRQYDFNWVRQGRKSAGVRGGVIHYGRPTLTLLEEARRKLVLEDVSARAVAAVLDNFHDCAAKADGPRYFGHFAPKGVFLGTDASERWPQAEFRSWGAKYFAGDSAWIFVPQERNIDVVGSFAWFDESLHSDSYGLCRGTGALQKIEGIWKIAQYQLTVPVPNPLLRTVVEMIRLQSGQAVAPGVTTVFVVRHAEKERAGHDPKLNEDGQARAKRLAQHLRSVDLSAAFATNYRRTQETVAPSFKDRGGLKPIVLDARFDFAKEILTNYRGKSVLVAGHSNTVPGILKKLGVTEDITLGDADYDDLFVVTIEPGGKARLLRLHY